MIRIVVFTKSVLYAFVFICLVSCKSNKKIDNNSKEVEILMREWTGKSIQIPDIQPTVIISKDSVRHAVTTDNKYKILLYVDSTGCTKCKLQLHIWKRYMEEINSKADFMFYFHPKTNKEELYLLFSSEEFIQSVYIDNNDSINKLNRFPDNPMFQCFLLDKDNKVTAIGNPVHNLKIWELYKKIIMK
jgi:hypothetical protein